MARMTELHNWLAPSEGSAAPLWTLDGLRGADPVLGFALVMLVAVALAELLHRRLNLPRMVGHMITGALTLALQPMSSLAVLLAADTLGCWSAPTSTPGSRCSTSPSACWCSNSAAASARAG
jgi:hypothetical protein